jgi:hypothetical protein
MEEKSAWAVYRTNFSITAGLRSKFYINRQLHVCRSKHYEEGFHYGPSELERVFIEASHIFIFYFATTRQPKNVKTIGAHGQNILIYFKDFQSHDPIPLN